MYVTYKILYYYSPRPLKKVKKKKKRYTNIVELYVTGIRRRKRPHKLYIFDQLPNYCRQIALALWARLPPLLADTITWCYAQTFLNNFCVFCVIKLKFGGYVDTLISLVYVEVGKLYISYAPYKSTLKIKWWALHLIFEINLISQIWYL